MTIKASNQYLKTTFNMLLTTLTSLLLSTSAYSAPEINIKKKIQIKSNTSSGKWDVDLAWVGIQDLEYTEALRGFVKFSPNTNSSPCNRLSFIQIAQVLDNEENDYQWPLGESPRNLIKTEDSFYIEPYYYIDHQAVKCNRLDRSCSPYFRDYWPNREDGSQDGSVSSTESKPAILVDYPFGWELISSIKLEACAVCRDDSKILSCFQWGGSWKTIGEPEFIVDGATEKPTQTFEEALSNFRSFYGK